MVDGTSLACIIFVFLVNIPCARLLGSILQSAQPASIAILQGIQLYFSLICEVK